MKTPYDQAMELYAAHPRMSFGRDINQHIAWGGHVVCTPEFIALARPVNKNWEPDRLANIMVTAPTETADCWFIWLLCGDLKEAVKHLPYPLPWFGFSQRGQPARFIEAEKVLAKLR